MIKKYLAILLLLVSAIQSWAVDRNVAGQKFTVIAIDSATGRPKTGDAAQITAYVSKDDGSVTVLADTSATEDDSTNAKGAYTFDASQGETDAIKLKVTGKSSTSGIDIIPQIIYTLPAGLSTLTIANNATAANTTRWNGTAVSSPATAGIPDINVKNVNNVSASSVTTINANLGTTQPINFTGTAGSALVKGDTIDWASAAVATPTNAGYPLIDIHSGVGTNQLLVSSGLVGVGIMNAGVITASSIAGNAFTSTAFATDCITSTALAQSAINEIAAANFPAGTIFVSTTGNDSNSGANWSLPKLTLAGAVSAVADGGRIVFGPGTFTTSAGVDGSAKTVELCGAGAGVTVLNCTSSATEMGIWLKGGSNVHDLSINRTGYTGQVMAALRIEGAGIVHHISMTSTASGLWMYSNAASDKQLVHNCCIQGREAAVAFGGRSSASETTIHSNAAIYDSVVETSDYTVCQNSAIFFQAADGLVSNCEIRATYPSTTATDPVGSGQGPKEPQGVRATEYSRVKVVGCNVRCGSLHATVGNEARAIMADLHSEIHVSGTKVTTFSLTSGATSLIDLFADGTSSITVDDVKYDTAKTSGSIVTSQGAAATAATTASTINTKLGTPAGASVSADNASTLAAINAGVVKLKKNTAFSAFPFYMETNAGSAATGKTVTAQRSLDGAAFATCANAVSEIGNGWYKINLAAADLNGNSVALKFTATGARQRNIGIVTQTGN